MELRRQFAIVRTWWRLIVLGTILAGLLAYVVSSALLPRVYRADARLLVGQHLQASGASAAAFQTSIFLARTYAELATDWPVLARVKEEVGSPLPAEWLNGFFRIEAADQQPFIEISATSRSAQEAADLANAMANALVALAPSLGGDDPSQFIVDDLRATRQQIDQTREERDELAEIEDRTAAQQQRLDTLDARLASLRAAYAALLQYQANANPNQISIVAPALVPDGPASPRPLFNTAVATFLGLLVMLGVAFGWEKFDDRLKTTEDVERVTGLPTLGQIVRMPGDRRREPFYRLAVLLYPRSTAAEAFRTVRTNIEFASVDEPIRSLVVTSAVAGEGKSVVAANLALVFAQAGRRTLLVDADMRRPTIDRLFQLSNAVGLTTLLVSDTQVADATQATEDENLRVITTGPLPPNPAELLNSHRMEAILARLEEAADIVIFDSPPVAAVTDSAVLSVRADGTILVVRASSTHEPALRRAQGALATVGARMLGVVLNGVGSDAHQPYYGSYQPEPGSFASSEQPATPAASAAAAPGIPRRHELPAQGQRRP